MTRTQASKPKGMRKRSFGSVRARNGMTAKAGNRKPPASKGPHITTPEDRARAKFLSTMGLATKTCEHIDHSVDAKTAYAKAEAQERRLQKLAARDAALANANEGDE